MLELRGPMALPAGDAEHAMWQLLLRGGWAAPSRSFPTAAERSAAPSAWAYVIVALCFLALVGQAGWRVHRGLEDRESERIVNRSAGGGIRAHSEVAGAG
jgi:hypothetical protein